MKTRRAIFYSGESKYLMRFAVTAIAVGAVLATAVIKAKLFGEFTWHVGW